MGQQKMGLSAISNFLAPSYSNNGILIVVLIIVTAIITDTAIIKTYDLFGKKESLGWRIIVFSTVVTISIVGQYLVLEFVRRKRISNIVNPRGDSS